jgi:hypothetical protein
MNRDFLRSALEKESRAYGFTIAFWGSGTMLIAENGLPTLVEALSYGGGAVLGFGLLTVLAYHRALGEPTHDEDKIMILGMVHYFSALLPIIMAAYLAKVNPSWISFGLTGITTSVGYNLGMLVEEALSEKIKKI